MPYQHGAPAMYQAQSGSPPPTALPRGSMPTNQQAASARPTVSLAPGVPQQQQVNATASSCSETPEGQGWTNTTA